METNKKRKNEIIEEFNKKSKENHQNNEGKICKLYNEFPKLYFNWKINKDKFIKMVEFLLEGKKNELKNFLRNSNYEWKEIFYWVCCREENKEWIEELKKEIGHKQRLLNLSCIGRNVEMIKHLCNEEEKLNWDEALNFALYTGEKEMVEIFIKKGAEDWTTALSFACASGKIEMVNLIMNKGAKISEIKLINACKSGNKEVVDYLIKNGAEFENYDESILGACESGNIEILKLFLSNGVDLYKSLEYGCKLGNFEIVEFAINNISFLIFHKEILYNACKSGKKEIVELLISKGADNWNEALVGACKSGNMEIVELLITKGADNWNEALVGACKSGNIKIVELLIKKGANDWRGALKGGCESGKKEIVELIYEKDLKKENTKIGKTTLLKAISSEENEEVVEWVLLHCEEMEENEFDDVLCRCCDSGKFKFVELLLQSKIKPPHFLCDAALFVTCENGNIGICDLLINFGVSNLNECFLHSIECGFFGMALFLVSRGANLNCRSHIGESPLNITLQKRNFSFFIFLLYNGAVDEDIEELLNDIEEDEDEDDEEEDDEDEESDGDEDKEEKIDNHSKQNPKSIWKQKFETLISDYKNGTLWKAERNHFFPVQLQSVLFSFLLSLKKFKIPKPILFLIIQKMVTLQMEINKQPK